MTSVVRKHCIADRVVFVDGLTRSGKAMLSPILASFERVEIERVEPIIERIGGLYRLGKIEKDAAIAFLRMETDQYLFDGMIGRNVNFRWEDHSSVWHNPRPWEYLRRLFLPERDAAMARIAELKPIYQNTTHRQLVNLPLLHEAFGDRLRMVEMVRHPVGLVDSWMRKRKGERIGSDPLINALCLDYRGQSVPDYALGCEEEFLAATPLGRVIRMIAVKTREWVRTWRALTQDQREILFMIPYEDFIQHPERHIDRLAAHIGTTASRRTPAALRKQRCPRPYDLAALDEKRRLIEHGASEEERRILGEIIDLHDTIRSELKS